MRLKVGTLCYATEQGLGYLAKSYYDSGLVTDPLVVLHDRRTNFNDTWYRGVKSVPVRVLNRRHAYVSYLLNQVDAMLFFETPFDWSIITECKRLGIVTFLMPMHECMPNPLPVEPDVFLCPSDLDMDCYPHAPDQRKYSFRVDVPVDGIQWRLREGTPKVFVHNAGNGGLRNRNGTGILLDAMPHVKSPIRLILRSQGPLQWGVPDDPRIDLRTGSVPRECLYEEGDAFIFPEKFNGLSLPLQEARASGMLVVATDRYPNTAWLPRWPLIPVARYSRERVSGRCREFDEAILRPQDIAQTIDRLYCGEYLEQPLREYSEEGYQWAKRMSWSEQLPKYRELMTWCVEKLTGKKLF